MGEGREGRLALVCKIEKSIVNKRKIKHKPTKNFDTDD